METAVAFTEDLIAANHDNLVNDYEYDDEMKAIVDSGEPVSYTHLDVYKRQARSSARHWS